VTLLLKMKLRNEVSKVSEWWVLVKHEHWGRSCPIW